MWQNMEQFKGYEYFCKSPEDICSPQSPNNLMLEDIPDVSCPHPDSSGVYKIQYSISL